ncbi:lytic murein transglycosylase [Salinarimonas soli]|uniref:Lytic murein transglycosylase n=1 Tax=Salinarimonas soli TaxID=1638099 RepID=A0A5B2VDA3_9HYPH|nr:lytic murein transglycosylase [Salinarimonas soli]KAA2236676.1 lytic murein transglycosylase [Salinarimonas soli]
MIGFQGRPARARGLALLLAAAVLAPIAAASSAAAQVPDPETTAAAPTQAEFRRFVEALWPEARQRGVSRATFDEAFRDVSPDPKIVALTKKQSEFVRPIWEYIGGAVSASRLQRGREMAQRYAAQFDAAERAYGVPRAVILGVWGMETNYGSFTGNIYAVRALATLTYVRYRGEFFRNELLTALQILEEDHIDRAKMLGSWAGAMGQTQFMPSSFMRFAVDGDGDGQRDIWSSVPDAIASTANYLKEHGWTPGLPWGYEVALPDGFDFRNLRQTFAGWGQLGVARVDGRALPGGGEATLLLPAGAGGPAFLVTANYDVIKAYNASDAYALGVGHLGDRVLGGPAIQGDWPTKERMLDKDQRVEVQKRLMALGFYQGETDGKHGSRTRDAVRQFQLRRGLVPDGYANVAVLEQLRRAR